MSFSIEQMNGYWVICEWDENGVFYDYYDANKNVWKIFKTFLSLIRKDK